MNKTTCSTMATAPGRPPPKAFVRAARTSKPLDDVALRGAGDFLRPAGFRAGDLARGSGGDAAAPAVALAARVATMACCAMAVSETLGAGTWRWGVSINAMPGLASAPLRAARAKLGKVGFSHAQPARKRDRFSRLPALQKPCPYHQMNRDEA